MPNFRSNFLFKSFVSNSFKYSSEHTANVSSQFHAALSLKPIAVREYKTLGKDGISSLKSHLVEFMKQRIDV